MATKGLPKKYAKHGFKKGWAMYKAAKRKRVSGKPHVIKTVSRQNKTSTGASKVPATIIRYRRRPETMASPVKKRRRPARILSQSTMNTVIDGAVTGVTAIGSTMMVNLIPIVKDQQGFIKGLSQAGLGVALLSSSKNRYLKKAGMGMIVGGAISGILPYLPTSMRVFGGARAFGPSQIAQLRSLGRPYSLSRPAAIPAMTIAGAPGRASYRTRAAQR